jgi:hypothetical protein
MAYTFSKPLAEASSRLLTRLVGVDERKQGVFLDCQEECCCLKLLGREWNLWRKRLLVEASASFQLDSLAILQHLHEDNK